MHSWHEVSLANIFDMSVPGDSNGESVPKKATKSGAMARELLLRLLLLHIAGARLVVEVVVVVAHVARIHRWRGRALQPVAPARERR